MSHVDIHHACACRCALNGAAVFSPLEPVRESFVLFSTDSFYSVWCLAVGEFVCSEVWTLGVWGGLACHKRPTARALKAGHLVSCLCVCGLAGK